MIEPTKVCTICEHRKPWSAFYKTPNGGPRWACRRCESALAAKRQRDKRRDNPEPLRKAARERYYRNRKNPEWVGERRAYNRENADKRRRRLGVPERTKRGVACWQVENDTQHDAGPFVDWLLYVMGRDNIGTSELARRLHMGDSLRGYVNGTRKQVTLAVVDAAIQEEGTMSLRDVYPNL